VALNIIILKLLWRPKDTTCIKQNNARNQYIYIYIINGHVCVALAEILLNVALNTMYDSYNLQLHAKSVPITTNVVSLNPADGEVYSIQHYVIQFVSDLRQVGGFLWFPPPIKLTATV
jgi:hypothetical protein